jgi:arylsulfatase A-like enzyme
MKLISTMRYLAVLVIFFMPSLAFSQNRLAGRGSAGRGPSGPPNVVIVLTDDQGYGDMACHGNPWIKTPTMDKLHAQSARFTNFHSGTTCAPTRASLMTGQYSNKVGVWHTIIGREYLRAEEPTMADLFRAEGYKTAIFGKWHLGDNYPFRPQDRGFDEVLIHGGGGVAQTPDYWNNDYFNDTYFHNGKPEKYRGYCTDVWFREAMRFIDKNKKDPFLCYISLNAPHSPYHVAPKYSQPYQNNPSIPNPNFYGMITNADEQMGLFIDNLKKAGVYENTIFVFMTDNGTAAGAEVDKAGNLTKGFNAEMRGKKGSQYEGGHRVPMFLSWPAKRFPARDITGLAGAIDLLPTLMDLCGLNTNSQFDGISLASAILDNTPIPDDRILVTDTQRGDMLVKGKQSAVMQGPWRLIDGEELYNLNQDPGQKKNVAQNNPELVDRLNKFYESWWDNISRHSDEFNRVVLGSEKQSMVTLTAHDFFAVKEIPAWNQDMIRLAKGGNGPWEVEVARRGTYLISLRRYPKESGLALNAMAAVPPAEEGVESFPPGKALDIHKARVRIGDVEKEMIVSPKAESADFILQLPVGKTSLETWLIDNQEKSYGAFYTYITRVR